MNEINLLRTHGPDAPEASTETLRLARDRLAGEIAAGSVRRTVPPLRRRTPSG